MSIVFKRDATITGTSSKLMKFVKVVAFIAVLIVPNFFFLPAAFSPTLYGKIYGSTGYGVWSDGTWIFICGYEITKSDMTGKRVWGAGGGGGIGRGIWGDGTSIYVCGYTDMNSNMFIEKWDIVNDRWLWTKRWGGDGIDYGFSVFGFGMSIFTAGSTESYGSGQQDIFIVKWDTSGNQIWNRTWGGVSTDSGQDIWVDSTGIYVCGYTSSFESYGFDVVLVKWDLEGNFLWYKTWGTVSDEKSYSIWGDSSAIYTCGGCQGDILLVKWDKEGNRMWDKLWGISSLDTGYAVWANDAIIYVSGDIVIEDSSDGSNDHDMVLAAWDKQGYFLGYHLWEGEGDSCGFGVYGIGSTAIITGYDPSSGIIATWSLVLIPNPVATILASIWLIFCPIITIIMLARKRNAIVSAIKSLRRNKGAAQRPPGYEIIYQHPLEETKKKEQRSGLSQTTCPSCGQFLPTQVKQSRYCVYCGKALP